MTRAKNKRISWDGVSFDIPENWELTVYKFLKKQATRIELEDEFSVRLEAEWIRPKKKLHANYIVKRYERASKDLTTKADRKIPVHGLPEGWAATRYVFKETTPNRADGGLKVVTQGLVTAMYLEPGGGFLCFLIFHFYPDDIPGHGIYRIVGLEHHHPALVGAAGPAASAGGMPFYLDNELSSLNFAYYALLGHYRLFL